MSFSLSTYDSFLKTVCGTNNMPVLTILAAAKYLNLEQEKRCLILRHDVDRRANRAVSVAALEMKYNVLSTFYFRSSRTGAFPERQIEKICEMGHEIGYHYECLSRSAGDRDRALDLFRQDLANLRSIAPCSTVSSHGAPLSPHDNGTLLERVNLSELNISADAVLSFNAHRLFYCTDTGGRWNAPQKYNRRDHVGQGNDFSRSPSDPTFSSWLSEVIMPIYVTTHPERWSRGKLELFESTLRDMIINQGKHVARLAQGRK